MDSLIGLFNKVVSRMLELVKKSTPRTHSWPPSEMAQSVTPPNGKLLVTVGLGKHGSSNFHGRWGYPSLEVKLISWSVQSLVEAKRYVIFTKVKQKIAHLITEKG